MAKDDAEVLGELEDRIGYRFEDPALLRRALSHRSYAYERTGSDGEHYERLEFLGDSLLGFVTSEWFWRDDPGAPEGILSRRKQAVVRARTLARAASRLGFGEALRLGRGEETSGGREKSSLLADVFESILGAIYVDGGLGPAREFVDRHLGRELREASLSETVAGDHKTRLQERVQASRRVTPRYRIVKSEGPAHARRFEVEVQVGEQVWGRGRGTSRKQAEQEAAREALQRYEGRGGEP